MKTVYTISLVLRKIHIFEREDEHYTHPLVQILLEEEVVRTERIEVATEIFDDNLRALTWMPSTFSGDEK